MEDGLWASCWIAFWTSTTSRRRGTWRPTRARRQALRGELAASFEKRARRPPPDPVNSLLGLGYTLLTEAMMTALEVVGLDPYIGFFHADKYGRPALALDLIEEFRAPVVDSLVLTLVNKRMLGPEDFEAAGDGDAELPTFPKVGNSGTAGVYLNQHGRRIFFREFADRLESETLHPLAGRRLSYRKIFEVQVRQAAKVISGEAEAYRAFVWR
jgi:CRISPR-associated protein Cas1